uniref:Uncharacterized protein n=1 Tax=Rhizophora mucronata TaxID=61149 RepID=A0A2P2QXJ3_RHIMU
MYQIPNIIPNLFQFHKKYIYADLFPFLLPMWGIKKKD